LLWLALLLLSVFRAVPAAAEGRYDPTSEQRADLLSVRESVWRSWYKNDRESLRRLVAPELIAVTPQATESATQHTFIASAQDFVDHHGRLISLSFPKTEIQIAGRLAVLYSSYDLQFELDGQKQHLNGWTTEVFVLRDGSWLNIGRHVDSGN
jgi:hypothetical protein